MGSAAQETDKGSESTKKQRRRTWRRIRTAARGVYYDIRYQLGGKPDYITRELREKRAEERARRLISGTHALNWLQMLLLLAVLVIGVLVLKELRSPQVGARYPFQMLDQRVTNIAASQVRLSKTLVDVDSRVANLSEEFARWKPLLVNVQLPSESAAPPSVGAATGNLTTQHWSFFGFDPGSYRCDRAKSASEKVCELKGKDSASFDNLIQVLSEPTSAPTIVLITGGHDNAPLRRELRREIGTNIQLGQLRAEWMREKIEHALDERSRKSVVFISVPRGASTLAWPTETDRGVDINVIRMSKS